MKYSQEEIMQYVSEEDVKFIRLAFCDVFGKQKNISIMPEELPRAFSHGIAFDASAITGFGDEANSDLLLHPEPETLIPLPWRPEHGRVVRMLCSISYPDGTPFDCDTRRLLKQAVLTRLRRATLSASGQSRSSICLSSMKTASRRISRTTTRGTWTLRPRIAAKTSGAKSV